MILKIFLDTKDTNFNHYLGWSILILFCILLFAASKFNVKFSYSNADDKKKQNEKIEVNANYYSNFSENL